MEKKAVQCKNASKIFEGYKALGLIAIDKPFLIRYIEKLQDLRIVVPVGLYFHTYNSKLQLIETSHAHPEPITAIAADSKHVFTSAGNKVFGWRHGHRWLFHTFGGHDARIHLLLNFGPHLVSVDDENIARVIEIGSGEITLSLPFGESFTISSLLHPSTYVNKVLFGCKQGSLKLWNIRTGEIVYTFAGWESSVISLEQAPAVDIVAIGLENGVIVIHNLRYDESLLKFYQEWGPVTRISFRTDGPPYMATSSTKGNVAIWDLEKKTLKTQKRDIHHDGIFGCQFINGEPLLLTSSADNSLKMWVFDDTDEKGRQLYSREGHSYPPTFIRFYGSENNQVLSVAPDSTLRIFSIWSERLNRSFGQASFNRKYAKKVGASHDPNVMPPIIEFTAEPAREDSWDNLVARHDGLPIVTTWTSKKVRMGSYKIIHERFLNQTKVEATSVAISSCGNFVVIGYTTGHVDRWNIQSGIFRLSYGEKQAHDSKVTGLACDEVSRILISGDNCGIVKFWNFKTGVLIRTLSLEAAVKKFAIHRESGLLAVALEDYTIRVIDIETKRIIRNLPSHKDEINDIAISFNSKWLIVASNDSSIRTWDLALGKLIDWFKMPSPCTSLSLSLNGEYLALSLKGELGIFIFTNLSLFFPISLRPLPETFEPLVNELPSARKDENNDAEEQEKNEDNLESDTIVDPSQPNSSEDAEMFELDYKSPDQISEDLITLSSLPISRWKNLLNLDLIKRRNKPKEPIQKPKSAPFFLPTLESLTPDFNVDLSQNASEREKSRVFKNLMSISPFGRLLLECSEDGNYDPAIKNLKSLSPNDIDTEIRSLELQNTSIDERFSDNEFYLLHCFLAAMKQALDSRKDYELIQSYLTVFLKFHSNLIMKSSSLVEACSEIIDFEKPFFNLRDKFKESLFILNFIRGIV